MLSMVNDFRTGNEAFYIDADDTTKISVPNLSELTWNSDMEEAAMLLGNDDSQIIVCLIY